MSEKVNGHNDMIKTPIITIGLKETGILTFIIEGREIDKLSLEETRLIENMLPVIIETFENHVEREKEIITKNKSSFNYICNNCGVCKMCAKRNANNQARKSS